MKTPTEGLLMGLLMRTPDPAPPAVDDQAPLLEKLTGFLAAFAPSVGEVHSQYDVELCDNSASFEIVESRNLAIVAAFQAVERIARAAAR